MTARETRSPWPPVVYVLTLPLWIVGLVVAVVAFVIGAVAPLASGAYRFGWRFGFWVFREKPPAA